MTDEQFEKEYFEEKEFTDQEIMEKEFGRKPRKGFKLVRNLMSGKVIEIEKDCPRCCDPSTELYWSM